MDFSNFNYSLEILLQEPKRLEKSIASLKNQFDESMTSNYDYFIKTCEDASTITGDLESCSSILEDLTTSLNNSIELCSDLCLDAQETVNANSKISAAFCHLDSITGIMDVPRLMRACQMLSLYDESLQLFQAIESFARQYPGLSSIQRTLEKAQSVKADVVQKLLQSFTGKLRRQDAVRNVNLLRTAGLQSEAELRLEFVNGRRKKMHEKLKQLPKSPIMLYVERMTGVYRTRISKLCTMYELLFQTDDVDDVTLNMAVHCEVDEYMNAFKEILNDIDDKRDARTAVEQALFFVGSLSKRHFNFAPLVYSAFYESKWAEKST